MGTTFFAVKFQNVRNKLIKVPNKLALSGVKCHADFDQIIWRQNIEYVNVQKQ